MPEPADLARLKALSARIGADPLRIQGPGGNTSLKQGETLWIKASGTQLCEAERRDIFVAVDLAAMRAALDAGAPEADRPALFVREPGALRPSIETSLHAVFPQRVVLHAHCVDTLALAIREDGPARVAERLRRPHGFVTYVKPGATLARAVRASGGVEAGIVVLGNHGLIVAADSVEAAAQVFDDVTRAFAAAPAAFPAPEMAGLQAQGGADYAPPPADHPLHGVALSAYHCEAALRGSLYPDHVIFCGMGATALAAGAVAQGQTAPFLLVPGRGALIARGASAGARALARCLGDVLARVPEGAPLRYLSGEQNAELIDWDAEKYRRALNVR